MILFVSKLGSCCGMEGILTKTFAIFDVVGGSDSDVDGKVEETAGVVRKSGVRGVKKIYLWATVPPLVHVVKEEVVETATAVVRMVVVVVVAMLAPKDARIRTHLQA